MALREILTSENTQTETRRRLVKILFTEGAQIYAVWKIDCGARHRELTVQVSEATRADIMGRAGVAFVIDLIRDDTKGNVSL